MAVIFRRCTDNHLRALPSRGKRRGVAVHRKLPLALRILHSDLLHRAQDGGFLFVGGKLVQADFARQFNIDRKPIRQKPQLLHQNGVGARYRLGVDIPVKAVFLAQNPQRPDHQLHRPVGGLDHCAGQKQPLDIIAFVEPDRQIRQLARGKAGARAVIAAAVDAVAAIVAAGVGIQHL